MLKIFCGNSSVCAEKQLIKEIGTKDLFSKKTVIVPDRFTLSVEQDIYETLEIDGSFNINCLTFLRMAKKFVSGERTLSKEGTVLLLAKIIRENKDKLKHYTRVCDKKGFADEVFTAIARLKLSNQTVEELAAVCENLEGGVKNKLGDILLLLKEYNREIETKYSDKAMRLDLLTDLIYSGKFDDTEFYILGFKRLDIKELKVVYALIDRAKSVNISLTYDSFGKNHQIYDTTLFDKFTKYAKNNNHKFEIVDCYTQLSGGFKVVNDNLFSFADEKVEPRYNRDFRLNVANNLNVEIENVAAEIAKLVDQEGYRYKDIAILNCDKTLNTTLERTFIKYKIPYFVDKKYNLGQTVYVNFINLLNELHLKGLRQDVALAFLKNPIAKIDENIFDFENLCLEYNISFDRFKRTLENEAAEAIRIKLLDSYQIINEFYQCKKVSCDNFIKFVEKINTKFEAEQAVTDFFGEQDNLYKEANLQAFTRVAEVVNEMKLVLGDEEIKIEEMFSVFLSMLSGIQIMLIPQYLDSIFVGELEESRFKDIKALFIVNASQDVFPRSYNYDSIFSDRDVITLQNIGIDMSPTPIDDINFEEFLILDLFTKPTAFISISYSVYAMNGEQMTPSIVFTDIEKMGFIKGNYRENSDFEKIYYDEIESVGSINYYFTPDEEGHYLTKISQLQTYFACPYRHHMDYGIRPIPRKSGKLETMEIGTIIHRAIEKFFKQNMESLENLEREDINLKCKIILNSIFMDERIQFIRQDKIFNFSLSLLEREICDIIYHLTENIKLSEFKPKYVELKFGKDSQFKEIIIDNNDSIFKFRGAIDRVDTEGDNIIIIDYKSGSSSAALKDVWYGEKIQLYLYVKNFIDAGYQISGVFYMPLTDGYSKDKRTYKMEGQILDTEENFLKIDKTLRANVGSKLYESPIVDFKFKLKENNIVCTSLTNNLTKAQFDDIVNYVINISKIALQEISEGYKEKTPLGDRCDTCAYSNICGEIKEEKIR